MGSESITPDVLASTENSPPPSQEEDSTAPADAAAPPPKQSSPPPPQGSPPPPPKSPPASPPPSSPPPSPPPTTPASSPPPPTESSPTPPAASRPPPPSSSSSPPPPSNDGSPPSPPPPSAKPSTPAPPSNTTPVTPTPDVFSPPPPDAPGRPLPSPSQPRPTPSGTSPATPRAGNSPSPSNSSQSNNTGVIVGAVLAGVVLIAFVGIWLLCTKKKKKQPYYADAGRPPKVKDPYYNGPNNWNSPNPMDHVVKLPPPPGVMGTPGTPATAWGVPPPPPPANTSSEFSSGISGMPTASPNMGMGGFNQSQFRYEELAMATGGFSQSNLLGQGGFGYVHKGVLSNGREVAVKSLKTGSGQGEREFQAEVEIISRVHHRHLVSLVGYCIADGQRMLVYEFVPNKTLEFHLHGKGQTVMEWEFRIRIALGSAKGLAYLHEDCHPRIIHRDIKAANILLDDKYEAMVADFGLAKLSSDNYTHVSTRVMGTFGYLAPEYASSGKLTEKSDVFSFGVMLLELIAGKRPVDPNDRYMEDSLVDWARPLLAKALEDGDYKDIADPRLEGNYVAHEMARMIACAAASIRHSARRRPKMSQIVRALEGDSSLEDLNDGPKQRALGSVGSTVETQVYDTGMYNADMSKFRKMVMNTEEFNSSEYGGTSDYGLNPSSSSGDSREYPEHQKPKA